MKLILASAILAFASANSNEYADEAEFQLVSLSARWHFRDGMRLERMAVGRI